MRTPAQVFHPGYFISEELEARGWGLPDLSDRSGVPVGVLEGILARDVAVTKDISAGLGKAFDVDEGLFFGLYLQWALDGL